MSRLYVIILLSMGFLRSQAQDPNFSQFFVSPLTLNPALTGKFDGTMRIAGNYRNQWPTINNAFTTYTVSADAGILKDRISENDVFGVGVMAFSDKSGNGVLQNNFIALSTSYHKSLDDDGMHSIGLGFQGTYVSKRLNTVGLNFEDMLRSDGFTGVTTEDFSSKDRLSVSYMDVNAGAFYSGTTNGDNNIFFGVSMYHINRHKETFNKGEYFLQPRFTVHGGARLPVGEFNAVHFSANYSRQANATNTMIGGAYELNLNAESERPTSLYVGSWYRLQDAVIPYIGLEFGAFRVGASYDVNISKLKPASNMRGGAEISLIYIHRPADRLPKLNCPKF
ncbi:type IX secretion system membrane protein PorP/SprF [Flaviaesturariibacter flavus]|uniref:Type IX secretion system membrane protein PorP/SprF n=1 Tax=Flaviaesturariibacter flavus TaxID=2502780 RepID=A0A4R1B7Z0_9BACT|nr:PorP/SprF family type IX secretion system membrane protein [Flaviaesturariibacter flavus]TCJ13327.1 type IX secretion system membrane protein PorP/SprF [Flaviaesturariibacter flavus]